MNDIFLYSKRRVFKNQLLLKGFIEKLSAAENLDEKSALVTVFFFIVRMLSTGRYILPEIEQVYLDLAKIIPKVPPTKVVEKSVLHVMTVPYIIGGHTQVVERWIEGAQPGEKHSIIFTLEDNQEAADKIKEKVIKLGGIPISLPEDAKPFEKAFLLKKIASSYQTIVLHTHPEDVVPLLAFGSEDFQRPVILFNHADHIPWYGISIADIVAEFRTFGQRITQEKRCCNRNFLLGLPHTNKDDKKTTKEEARKQLGISQDATLFLSVGGAAKYFPMPPLDYSILSQKLLDMDIKNEVYIIGVPKGSFITWDELEKKSNNRFRQLGIQERESMLLYMAAADMILDSFPMSGCMALIDAINLDRPVLSLECPVGQSDFIIKSQANCKSIDELINKAQTILKSSLQRDLHLQHIKKLMEKDELSGSWQERVQALYNEAAKRPHRVYPNHIPDDTGFHTIMQLLEANNIQDIDTIKDKDLIKKLHTLLSATYSDLDVYIHVKQKQEYVEQLIGHLESLSN